MTAAVERVLPHILLVDENPDDLSLIQQSCVDSGVPAVFHLALDGVQALDCVARLAKQGSPPKLIVLDILLPGKDGFQVLKELRGRSDARDIPVIILTGSSDMRHVDRSFRMGADLYLYKPVVYDDKRVIAQRMAELLEHQPASSVPAAARSGGVSGADVQRENDGAARRAS